MLSMCARIASRSAVRSSWMFKLLTGAVVAQNATTRTREKRDKPKSFKVIDSHLRISCREQWPQVQLIALAGHRMEGFCEGVNQSSASRADSWSSSDGPGLRPRLYPIANSA